MLLTFQLRTKYAARAIVANGRAGSHSNFTAELVDHRVRFVVLDTAAAAAPSAGGVQAASATKATAATSRDPIDTFTLTLPYIRAVGRFRYDTGAAWTADTSTT